MRAAFYIGTRPGWQGVCSRGLYAVLGGAR